jgi:nitroreductase
LTTDGSAGTQTELDRRGKIWHAINKQRKVGSFIMETMKAIAKRKSTREFKPDQIPEAALDTILNAGCAAPVGMRAYDTLHLTVVQDANLLKKLSDTAINAMKREGGSIYYGAPTVVIVSSKKTEAPGLDYANAACIVENMLLAATDAGIDNVYIFGTVVAFQADAGLLKTLDIPEGFFPVASAALGYGTNPSSEEKTLGKTLSINRK